MLCKSFVFAGKPAVFSYHGMTIVGCKRMVQGPFQFFNDFRMKNKLNQIIPLLLNNI